MSLEITGLGDGNQPGVEGYGGIPGGFAPQEAYPGISPVVVAALLYNTPEARFLAAQADIRVRDDQIARLLQTCREQALGIIGLREELARSSQRNVVLEGMVKNTEVWATGVIHDARTPLTAMRGNAQLLSSFVERLGGEADQQGRISRVQMICKQVVISVDKLSKFLGNLEDGIRRIEKEENVYGLNTGEVSMATLLDKVLKEVRVNFSGRTIDVIEFPDVDPSVKVNMGEVERVVINLVGNAAKYSPNGGNVEVSVRVSDDRSKAVFLVKDYGIGIDPADLERVFEDQYRTADAIQSGIKGSGIGLKVVKDIVEAHGGEVGVESEGKGQGSTFHFTLPVVSSTKSNN